MTWLFINIQRDIRKHEGAGSHQCYPKDRVSGGRSTRKAMSQRGLPLLLASPELMTLEKSFHHSKPLSLILEMTAIAYLPSSINYSKEELHKGTPACICPWEFIRSFYWAFFSTNCRPHLSTFLYLCYKNELIMYHLFVPLVLIDFAYSVVPFFWLQ